MKLLITLITLLFSIYFSENIFAQSNDVIWSKYLGKGITWQQTLSGDILKYNGKIIDSGTGGFIDDSHMLCAYQGMNGDIENRFPFSATERYELEKIGVITNGSYLPPNDPNTLSTKDLNTLYRITSRYCAESKVIVKPEIGKRWIYIIRYNTVMMYDTTLGIWTEPFQPEKLLRKSKYGFFAVGLSGGNERVEFLPLDGKSYIVGMNTLFEEYSEGDPSASIVIDNYHLLKDKKIRVTFSILHNAGNKTYTRDFAIITP